MKKIFLIILIVSILIPVGSVFAEETFTVDFPSTGFSGGTDIGSFINDIYNTALGVGGIAAVAVIVYGSIYLTISGASPDKQKEGRDIITAAIWGVVLLFGAYVVLNTINPQLVELSSPRGPQLTPTTTSLGPNFEGQGCMSEVSQSIKDECSPQGVYVEGGAIPSCETGYAYCIDPTGDYSDEFGCYDAPQGEEGTKTKVGDVSCDPSGTPVCDGGKLVCEDPPGSPEQIQAVDCSGWGGCSEEWQDFENVTIQPGGEYYRGIYYPEETEYSEARCVVYAYVKTLNGDHIKQDIDGLQACY
ncbi:MAG: hypothetical protein WDZ80_04940 [Candidatus Paceibacterota bacterium]